LLSGSFEGVAESKTEGDPEAFRDYKDLYTLFGDPRKLGIERRTSFVLDLGRSLLLNLLFILLPWLGK